MLVKLPPEVVARYRMNAWLGLLIWLVSTGALLALVILRPDHANSPIHSIEGIAMPLGIVDGLISFGSFFWGTYSLALAKGYPWGVMFLGILGPPAQVATLVALLFMEDKQERFARQEMRRNVPPPMTNNQRIAICRKNAAMCIPAAVLLIAAGIALLWVRTPLSRDAQRTVALGLFMVGHCAMIVGCWYWLRAKHWTDVILLIGVVPFALLAIPTVRQAVQDNKGILTTGMAMLPLILLALTVVLPDNAPGVARGE